MIERYVFIQPSKADDFMTGIFALGVETDTEFRIDAPGGNIILHVRGTPEAIAELEDVPGYSWATDRLA